MQPDAADFLKAAKDLGFAVKLDTNGCYPARLAEILKRGLVDYVAMDIKNSPARYGQTAGVPAMTLDAIEESIRYLLAGNVDYEFRTTVVAQLHSEESIEAMGKWLLDTAGKLYDMV